MTGDAVAPVLAFLCPVLAFAALGLAFPVRDRGPSAGSSAEGRGLLRLLRATGAAVGRRVGPPRDLAGRIVAAGRPGGLGSREVMVAKLAGAAVGGAVGAAAGAAAPGRLGPLVIVAAPVAAFLAPDLWLARLTRARSRRILRELPATLDLLRVTVESGASLGAALAAVGERGSGVLATELRAVARETALGRPRAAALDDLAGRVPVAEVAALVAALGRAERHGAPLGDTLEALARDARLARRRRIEEAAARAGPKIQLVVALLLVPSVLLLVAAGLASALLDGQTGLALR